MKPRFPRIISFLARRYPRRLWACVLISTLASLSESLGVLSILPIITIVLGQQPGFIADDSITKIVENIFQTLSLPLTLPVLLSVFFSGILLKTGLNLLALQQAGYASAIVARDIRYELVTGLMRARWPHFINLRIGEMTNLVTGEPDRVGYSFPALVRFMAAIFQIALYTVISFYASPAVSIAAFIMGGLIFICIRSLIRVYQRVCTEQAIERNNLADKVTQILNGFKSIKAMNLEDRVKPLLLEGTDKLGTLYRKEVLSKAALQSVFEPAFALCLCFGVVMFTVIYPQPLAQLMFMALLLQRLMSHMSTFQGAYQNLTAFDGILDQYMRHKKMLDSVAEEIQSESEPQGKWQSLVLKDVAFSYGETPVLHNISATFPTNSLTVVLGPSGSGKSTLLDILAGLQYPAHGQLYLDDKQLQPSNIYDYRRHLGYLPQEPILLNDTIRRNVLFGDERFSEDDLKEALHLSGLTTAIEGFSEGLDTIVGERGGRLSGGQRQRLMLARALIRKPSLLLLDEPLSALDADTASALCQTLNQLKAHLAIIAVSHQHDILQVADHVYEMNKGQLQQR